jgi:nucleoside-diphosphate-sugar epimerase
MMKIFLTGATGFVGSAVLKELLRLKGYKITCLVRELPPAGKIKGWNPVVGDLADISSFETLLHGHDIIIHCAGRAHILDDRSENPFEEFRRINAEGTLNLARAGAFAGVQRFIFLSSIKVNGEETIPGYRFDHTSAPHPIDPYGVSKHEAEKRLRMLSAECGLQVCIIRPTLVYGHGVKGNVRRLIQLSHRGLPLPIASMKNNKRSMIHIDNLVSLIITCIHHRNAGDATFLASDDQDMSTSEFVDILARLHAVPIKQVHLPLSILRWLARVLGYEAEIKRLTGNLQVNIQHTKSELDWIPPHNWRSE